jgi:branched-chain amino acid transport system ATP-binding protein
MLQVNKLIKRFGGLVALDALDMHIADAEILGVIGPNGAGKTTLFNAISGFFPPTCGTVIFNGREITGLRADEIAQAGIGRTFQAATLFMNLSVLDNVFVGSHLRYRMPLWRRIFRTRGARKEERELRERGETILQFMGLGDMKNELAINLSHGHQKILSICIALATGPKLLLLDEPVTGMNPTEIQTMVRLIRRIRDDGITIAIVEHNMRAIVDLCDRLVVLNYGQKIAEGPPEDILENEQVVEAYLGEKEAV